MNGADRAHLLDGKQIRTVSLNVRYHDRPVGTLALYQRRLAAFEYCEEWLADGFSVSPFSLPLEKKVFLPKEDPLEGLFGVFADNLPDGWGRLLVDRLLQQKGNHPAEFGVLDRLAIVGDSGMGALTYEPSVEYEEAYRDLSLDEIAKECTCLLKAQEVSDLDYLFQNGGSSGGARPKVCIRVDSEEWIVKFPASEDDPEIGRQEYDYAVCAGHAGLDVSEVRLFPSKRCEGYFGTRRFDRVRQADAEGRQKTERIHMVSAAGLLETSHRIPNLDYDLLMRMTLMLTKSMGECERLYRVMCFNVFAHNRDDHSKNFSYLYLEREGRWTLSPAYDMTYSSSIGGEHATMVHGNGRNPGMEDVLAVAGQIGISKSRAKRIAFEIQEIVQMELGKYLRKR